MIEDRYKQLETGQRFKSYKDLCDFLEEPIKTGNSKKAQLNLWSKYFSWNQERYEFIIKEVQEIPLSIVSEREYNLEIKNILIDLFENDEGTVIQERDEDDKDEDKDKVATYYFTKKNLALYLGMFNNRFDILSEKISKNNLREFLKDDEEKDKQLNFEEKELKTALQPLMREGMIIEDISTYISYAKNRIYQLLQRNLNYLQTDQLIKWSNREIFIKIHKDIEGNILWIEHIEASSNQEVIIQEIKKREALKLGYNNTSLLLQKEDIREKYYENVNKEIQKEFNYDGVYSIIRIKFYKERIAKEYCKIKGIDYTDYLSNREKYKIAGRDIHQLNDIEYFENKKELSKKIYKGIGKGIEGNYRTKERERQAKEKGNEEIIAAKKRGNIKEIPREGLIGQDIIKNIEQENKEEIKKIYKEAKESLKDKEITVKKEKLNQQNKLNEICVVHNEDTEKLEKKELKERRDNARNKVTEKDRKIKGSS